MIKLVKEITKGLLEDDQKVVGVYGGGFKPPTYGHFKVVKQALEENPEIDEFVILIGGKERDGVTPEESLIIWDIYKQYLPLKVEVKLSPKPPIQAVYNYAKTHPEEKVLFVIGAREGNEDDFSDIAKRTKSLDNYNNLELRTIITQGGASGTAARNAAKISVEKLRPFLPPEVTDEEAEEIFGYVNNVVNEETKKINYTNPNFRDEWEEAIRYPEFKEMGVKNWIKIANKGYITNYSKIKDKLGNVDLKFNSLEEPKKQRFQDALNKGNIEMSIAVKFSDDDYDLVAGNTRISGLVKNQIDPKIWIVDLSNDLNEAIVGEKIECDNCDWSWNIKDGGDDLFVCHKCGYDNEFKTSMPVGEDKEPPLLKEILDPTNFDFKPLIKSLTNSMEKDGLNLKPYPKVKFIHTDFENSDNFFGKTAYYDPNNNEVVLYTLGRHPKDILRSYAHELIHVHQNHEDRLENINTDNVNEDDYLEKIEREAYETGNIMFRSWTNKDPFNLAENILEIAEDEPYYIYLDMDGVVADFDKRFKDLSGMMPQAYVDKNGLNDFWDLIDEKHKVAFWRGIELMPGAEKLVKFVEQYPFEMLTAPSIKKQSIIGKGLWVKDKVGILYSTKPKVTYRSAKQKHTVKSDLTKFDILIDDKGSTIDNWNAAGGTGIFYKNADQVINDLKKLGL